MISIWEFIGVCIVGAIGVRGIHYLFEKGLLSGVYGRYYSDVNRELGRTIEAIRRIDSIGVRDDEMLVERARCVIRMREGVRRINMLKPVMGCVVCMSSFYGVFFIVGGVYSVSGYFGWVDVLYYLMGVPFIGGLNLLFEKCKSCGKV